MKGFFSVVNYEQYQHYKDRDPSWIKLYNRLLDSYDFGLLPDASKWHLIGIFLLASRYKNKIPADANWVAARLGATVTVDLTLLAKSGFIEIDQVRTEPLALSYQPSMPEKRTSTEEDKKELMSDFQSDPSKHDPQSEPKKTPYPEPFQAFWREYPTDPLMSKKAAFEKWKRLSSEDRGAALAAIPAFKDHCRKNPNYRPVHAQKFISERRFDGFVSGPKLSPAEIEANMDRADKLLRRGKYAPERTQ